MTFEYYNRAPSTAPSSKNKKQLTVGTASRTQRKYLGEPDDPHYIPKSPIISRQHFSEQDEGELKRLCTLALADVPHSDGPDPVVPPLAPRVAAPQPSARKASEPTTAAIKPPQPHFAEDSRTPSEASRRDTFGSSYSTPQSSTNLTPSETTKRFSSSKQPQNSSNLRYDQWQQQLQTRGKSHTYPAASTKSAQQQQRPDTSPGHFTQEIRKSTTSAAAAERTLRFVKSSRDPSPSNSDYKSSKSKMTLSPTQSSVENRWSQAALNKKLPPLPSPPDNTDSSGPKTAPLARMLQQIRRKKSSIHDEDVLLLNTNDRETVRERPGTSLAWSRSAPSSPAIGGQEAKRRFLRMFGRREPKAEVAVA